MTDGLPSQAPDYFLDLNLDQIVDALVKDKAEYNLLPFFISPLKNVDAIRYRQDVFRDLDQPQLLSPITTFGQRFSNMRDILKRADKIRHRHERNAWFLEAVDTYCDAVTALRDRLGVASHNSAGLLALTDYLNEYVASERFRNLVAEKQRVHAALENVTYVILIGDGHFTVRKYDDEPDYSAEVEATFAKFKQGSVKDYRVKFSSPFPEMNHIEQQALTFVAQLYPVEFTKLEDFCSRNRNYIDETIARFDREVQFYLDYLSYIAPLRDAGLQFCYPGLAVGNDKNLSSRNAFDLALARKLVERNAEVVTNDFFLRDPERIIVVGGPNQGGKTTFARTFGQLHYLAALGCPVAGSEARLYLFDKLFTQFEREETIENLRGKLEDDLYRLRHIVDTATSSSIVVLNEIFNSTTVWDAIFLSKHIMQRLLERDVVGVWVTFIDEISAFSEKTVSMVSTVVPENPAIRTFKIVRRPADGLAYAIAIAEKHRVTYDSLKERITA